MSHSAHRRKFLKRSLGVATQAATFGSLFTALRQADAAVDSVVQTIPVGSGVTVPQKFLGMHFHYWPTNNSGSVSPAPKFGFGTWRSHDYYGNGPNGFRWLNLNPTRQAASQGIYASAPAVWNELDSVIKTHASAGRDIYFTLYGTPSWAARTEFSALPITPSAPLANTADIALFVKALLSRYNFAGSATPIRYLEIWNEPNVRGNSECTFSGQTFTWKFTESAGVNTGLPVAAGDQVFFTSTGALPTGLTAGTFYFVKSISGSQFTISKTQGGSAVAVSRGSGKLTCHFKQAFFWGQSTDMAAMAKAVYQAAKAIDPSVIVVSPGFAGSLDPRDNQVTTFLNASDGAGGYGRNWCDAISIHPYDTTVDGSTVSPQLSAVIQAVRKFVASGGLTEATPLLIGEQGWQASSKTSQSYFLSDDETTQAKKIVRHALVSAACGMQKHIFYDYDGPYLGATSVAKSSVKQSLLDQFHNNICGQKIILCEILASGTVRVSLASGKVYAF